MENNEIIEISSVIIIVLVLLGLVTFMIIKHKRKEKYIITHPQINRLMAKIKT